MLYEEAKERRAALRREQLGTSQDIGELLQQSRPDGEVPMGDLQLLLQTQSALGSQGSKPCTQAAYQGKTALSESDAQAVRITTGESLAQEVKMTSMRKR